MQEIFDQYCWEKRKKVLTHDFHKINGLGNFAHCNVNHASKPKPLHYHSNIIEFHCLVKGQRSTTVGAANHLIHGNEIFITFPYEVHQTTDIAESPCEFYGFQLSVADKSHLLGLDEQSSLFLADQLLTLPNRHLRFSQSSLFMLKKAFEGLQSDEEISRRTGLMYLCCFLFEVPRLEPVLSGLKHHGSSMQNVISFVDSNFHKNLKLENLAEVSGYSLSRFKIKFKEEVGITPSEFLTRKRLEYARQQLRFTSRSITDIAIDAGFQTSNYFSSVFRKYMDCTPLAYRRRFRSAIPKPDETDTLEQEYKTNQYFII